MRGPGTRGNAVGKFTWTDDGSIEWELGSTIEGVEVGPCSLEDDDVKNNNQAFILNKGACAALKKDGSVVIGGGGGEYNRAFSDADKERLASGVKDMVACETGFAFLKDDGSVVMLGDCVEEPKKYADLLPELTGVNSIVANRYTFAALKTDGSVVIFGHPGGGFNSIAPKTKDVKAVYAHPWHDCFFYWKKDGSVEWVGRVGFSMFGTPTLDPALEQLTDVQGIFLNEGAMAAVKGDGSLVVVPSPETPLAKGEEWCGFTCGEDGNRIERYTIITDNDGKAFVEKVTEEAKATLQVAS